MIFFLFKFKEYSNQPARTHGWSENIEFEKNAPRPEISAKMCLILPLWFGRQIVDTFFWKYLEIRWLFFKTVFCVETYDQNNVFHLEIRTIFSLDFPKRYEEGKLWYSGKYIFHILKWHISWANWRSKFLKIGAPYCRGA